MKEKEHIKIIWTNHMEAVEKQNWLCSKAPYPLHMKFEKDIQRF